MFSFFSNPLQQITPQEFKKLVDSGANYTLVDVRTPDEYREGHIKGSTLLPLDQLEIIEKKIPDKKKAIYVNCRSGARSSQAVQIMQKLGYTQVFNLTGGIMLWQNLGYPLEK